MWLPKPSSHTNTCLFRIRIKPETERGAHTCQTAAKCCYALDRHQQAHKGFDFQSQTYSSVFSSPEQSLCSHSRIWLPRIWRTLRCPRGEWSTGISLCLVVPSKLEKSKVKTHTSKLKPAFMSTGENDRKVITMPNQQNFPEQSSF